MKKLLSIIGTLNLSIVPTVSTISCSLFGKDGSNDDEKTNEDEKKNDGEDLNISQTEEKAIESAVKSVDDTVILTKLEGGINANNILTTNSTFKDAIEFLQENAQEIDSSSSVESNVEDKSNNNLIAGNNTISVKF